jgi:magnesium transporter
MCRWPISVGVGMTCAIFCASLLGMLLPHMFRKVGVDPAIASGPIVTTTNDIVSVSLYFFVGLAVVA